MHPQSPDSSANKSLAFEATLDQHASHVLHDRQADAEALVAGAAAELRGLMETAQQAAAALKPSASMDTSLRDGLRRQLLAQHQAERGLALPEIRAMRARRSVALLRSGGRKLTDWRVLGGSAAALAALGVAAYLKKERAEAL